jgi:hypothetical protein
MEAFASKQGYISFERKKVLISHRDRTDRKLLHEPVGSPQRPLDVSGLRLQFHELDRAFIRIQKSGRIRYQGHPEKFQVVRMHYGNCFVEWSTSNN